MIDRPFKLSAKVIIRNGDGHCLLLRRSSQSKGNAGKWDLPGGKVDDGETFDAALLREVREETGLEIRLDRVAGAAQSELPERCIAYIILEGQHISGTVRLSSEHDHHQWVESAAMADIDLCPQFKGFAETYAAGS